MSDPAERTAERLASGEVREVQRVVAGIARRTPILTSRSLSERCGGRILLKAENLQRTGSFKLRGALAKLHALGPCPEGVVTGSAGNHAQSLAYAARERGVPCEVFMPGDAPVAKVAAVRAFGGVVHPFGESVDECLAAARERAAVTGAAFVHPFDDPDVILGQATLGLELLDDVADLARVIVPVGGGGLASGVAGAIEHARPGVSVVGVQVQACPSFPTSMASGQPTTVAASATIADGIAVKRPGAITLALVQRWLEAIALVSEDDVADAMVWLLERAKLVVEGAGAVGVAALLAGAVAPAQEGATVVILSGGNVDAGLLARVAERWETGAGRRLRLFTRIPDRPGGLAALLGLVADAGGNIVHVEHVREAVALHVRQTGLELALETRGPDHAQEILHALAEAGYEVEPVGGR